MSDLPPPFDSFRLEVEPGHHKDFGLAKDDPYPLRGVTYPVAYGDILGFTGEDGADLDVFIGSGELLGYIKVWRDDTPDGEHKFYVNVTESEEADILSQFGPVITEQGRFASFEGLLAALEPFRNQ